MSESTLCDSVNNISRNKPEKNLTINNENSL